MSKEFDALLTTLGDKFAKEHEGDPHGLATMQTVLQVLGLVFDRLDRATIALEQLASVQMSQALTLRATGTTKT